MKISQQIRVLMAKVNSVFVSNKDNLKAIESINNQADHILEQVQSLELYVERQKLKPKEEFKNVLD